MQWDFVNIYNDYLESNPTIPFRTNREASLHGNEIPDPVILSAPRGLVQFTSDWSVAAQGFEATFSCVPPPPPAPPPPLHACTTGVSLTDFGHVDFVHDDEYDNDHDCQWCGLRSRNCARSEPVSLQIII